MNKRIVCPSIGLAAMCITLAALPGSSQKVQVPDDATVAKVQARLEELRSNMQKASATLSDHQELLSKLQDLQQVETSDDDQDVQVFVRKKSWLGVETHEVTSENVKTLKLPAEYGVLVGKIIPESPAAKAGLKEKDVITEINGQRVEGTEQFRRMIREIPSGRTAQLTILRDGHSQKLTVTLGSAHSNELSGSFVRSGSPGSFVVQVPDLANLENREAIEIFTNSGMASPRIGIEAEDLRGSFGTYFGAPDGEGILVRNVFSGTPAEKAGLKTGDVITSIDGNRVRSISDLREQLKSSKPEGKSVKLGILRNKSSLTLELYFPVPPKSEIPSHGERTDL